MASAAPSQRRNHSARAADATKGEWQVGLEIQRKVLCSNCKAVVDIPSDRSPGIANSARYDTDLIPCWNCRSFRDEHWLYGERKEDGKVWWFQDLQWLEDGLGALEGTIHQPQGEGA